MLEACRLLLGHGSLEHTSAYLSVTRADAFARARGIGALGDQRRRG